MSASLRSIAGRLGPLRNQLLVGALTIALGVRLLVFVERRSVDVFFWDQWDFLHGLFAGVDPWTGFRWQHGPGRMGLGYLATSAIFAVTHWSNRAEELAGVVLVFGAVGGALILKWRVYGASLFDTIIPVVGLSPTQYETFLGASNLSHGPLPLALVVAFAHCWRIQRVPVRVLAISIITFFATFTEFAFFLCPIAALLLAERAFALRGTNKRASLAYLAGVAACGASVAAFLPGYEFKPAVACFQFPDPHPFGYLPFLALIGSRPLGIQHLNGIRELVGPAIFATELTGFVCAAWRLLRLREETWRTAFVFGAFSLAFAASTAIGRLCLGLPHAATSSRYVIYLFPLVVATYLAWSQVRWRLLRAVVPSALLLLAVLQEVRVPAPNLEAIRNASEGKRRWVACYLTRQDVAACDREADFAIYPDPAFPGLLEELAYLKAHRLNLFYESPVGEGPPAVR